MPTLANKRNEYLDKTYDEDLKPLGPVEEEEEYTGPPFVEPEPVEPEEYKADAPVKRVESHQRSGAAIIDPNDSLQNRTAIDGNTYGVGDYVEGLGMIEDIDEHGNPTILPDDPDQPAFRLGQSEVGPEGKAEEPESDSTPWWKSPSVGEFLAKMGRLSGLAPASRLSEGEEPTEEQRLFMADNFGRSILEPEEEHQYMLDYIYPGLTDEQVDQAVWKDYNDSTPIDGTRSYNEDGTWIQQFTRPDGETITLKGYGEGEGETPRANITGATE